MSAGYPVARPRRLRRTPACAGWWPRPRCAPGTWCCRVRQGRPQRSAADRLDAGRGPAHQGQPAQGSRGSGGCRGGRDHRVWYPRAKDGRGSAADDPEGISQLALADLRAEIGDACVVMADLCLCEYTDHGHCGLLTPSGDVGNDATLERYAAIAVAQAQAGADMVAPSGMMDGQVAAIRAALDEAGHDGVGICAYSAKYASAFYGPFREAARARRRSVTGPAISRTRPTRSRRCARWRLTSTRAPTW